MLQPVSGSDRFASVSVTLVSGLLSRGQGPERPATGHLDTGFS